jgi:hydrogenase-4 transcriptional activator
MLLPALWREVSRHEEIAAVVERVAGLIAGHVPASGLLVRRVDWERLRLDTVASTGMGGAQRPVVSRWQLTASQAQTLRTWARERRLTSSSARAQSPVLDIVTPTSVNGYVVAGPLVDDDGVVGVLVVTAARGGFRAEHEAVVQSLLEPFAVALRNDVRLHELTRLREALEADKQALLSRLGRQEITDAIVGAEAGLRDVMARVAQVAPTDVPVLLLGETGSGKEVVAREIHRRSARAAGPIVRINCGAIPPGLIDSELFGHERGSFTGAVAARTGWFERADGGTLFLDEIGELAADAQVRLLRVLQDGTFERVGGTRTCRADVRIVAATHRDLFSMVRAGTFREDLWYRIGVFPVTIPSLRERPQDIPALAAHFAWRAGQRLTGAPLAPTTGDIDLLVSYAWPGNVRELAAVIERATILGGGHTLAIAAALGGMTQVTPRATTASCHTAAAPISSASTCEFPTLDQAMARHIDAALQAARGKIEGPAGAAALLGINPHTLRARMRKLGIDWTRHRPLRADLSTA